MAISKKILNFLGKAGVKYESIEHRTVYTAYDKAATLRVPQKIVGKTLVIKFDRSIGLVLIPANKNLDKMKLKKAINAGRKKTGEKIVKKIDFAIELWMKKNLKGAKIGAIPCFGSLWKLLTFVDRGLLRNPKIIINSGDYNWSIKISPNNLKKLIPNLILGNFSEAKKKKNKKKIKRKK